MLLARQGVTRVRRIPTVAGALTRIPYFNRASRMKEHDIAAP